jgi:outer membrane protein assembly factor BamB
VAHSTSANKQRPKGEWPLPGQNNRYLSQAELPCDMPNAPDEVWSYDLGRTPIGNALCADVDDDGEMEILYGANPLICVSLAGKEKWRCSCGGILAIADVDEDGHTDLVVGGAAGNSGSPAWIRGGKRQKEPAPRPAFEAAPAIIGGSDGRVLWQRTGPGVVGDVAGRCQIAKLLPQIKGLQIACVSEEFGTNSKIAQVWSFADGCENAKLVWERPFAVWEHAGSMVGRYSDDTICLMSPTWGGLVALDVRDGKDLMRLYWEEAPGKSGLRNYGPLFVTQLGGDEKPEFVILAQSISQHIDVIAPWRGSPGEFNSPAKPWPAPRVAMGELVSYSDGPNLWRRYFGTVWPQDDFIMHVPAVPVADVDGDGKKEIIVVVGKDRWELKVYEGMTGAEKLSRPIVEPSATVFDFDGDGIAEIAVQEENALVIGSFRQGRWEERAHLEGGRLWMTARQVAPARAGETFRLEQQPIAVRSGSNASWIITRHVKGDGARDELLLLDARPGAPFTFSKLPIDDAHNLQILAATGDQLIAATNDGSIRVINQQGQVQAQWPCGNPFVSQPAVADLDGDGVNEVVACKAGGKVAALSLPGKIGPAAKVLWEVDGSGLETSLPSPYPAPLIADVDGNGKKETLVVANGTKLLDCRGDGIWHSKISASRATFGDFNGDGHLDVFVAAWAPLKNSIGTTIQSFALDGRNGAMLWHNDGSTKSVWHHQLGPLHRLPTVTDINGDGCDDVLFVAMDLLVALNGKDGSFLQEPVIANEIWKQQAGKDGQWTAYGVQIPLDIDGDGKQEILLAANWGQWGAWKLDRHLLWTFNPEKSQLAQRYPGIADVDGDGKLEIGVIHDGGIFRCYDATTGRIKWELGGIKQTTDVVTGDVDGDGRPEFLAGLAAFKAINQTSGKVLWEAEAPAAHAPVVADVDGDGFCEIILGGTDGKIRVYKRSKNKN